MKKKLFSVMALIIALSLVFSSFALELETVESAEEKAAFCTASAALAADSTITGSGTETDPYIIDEAADFMEISTAMSAKTTYLYKQLFLKWLRCNLR